jgi:hypothetical protein
MNIAITAVAAASAALFVAPGAHADPPAPANPEDVYSYIQ